MFETYTGRDYGDHLRAHYEWLESLGLLEGPRDPDGVPEQGTAIRFVEPVTSYPLDERPR